MEAKVDNDDIPQWKKDLIARLRNQNRTVAATGSGDQQQLYTSPQLSSIGRAGHQPSLTCKSESVTSGVSCPSVSEQCNVISTTCSHPTVSKMVQERVWVDNKHDPFVEMVSDNYGNNGYHKDSDSDSSEDLHYGPGIVNKLKNKYLSLALRESNVRPSILHLRKATSLENLLDDDVPNGNSGNRQFQSRLNGNDTGRNIPNRYRNATRGEMKRARSVEAISRFDNHVPLISTEMRPNRQSLHEEMLIAAEKEGNDHPHRKVQDNQLETNTENKFNNSNYVGPRVNRPKRIQPIMNEKEKPPADVVKQTKMIFERRPEQRTKAPPQTGDVAAKVDSFNNIIVKAKVEAKVVSKKPPIKHTKPVLNDKIKSNTRPSAKPVVVSEEIIKSTQVSPPRNLTLKKDFKEDLPLPSPIPDVSRIDFHSKGENERGKNVTSLSETPDLILTSSPLPAVSSPTYKKSDSFLKEEIRNSSPILGLYSPLLSPTRALSPLLSPRRNKPASPLLSPSKNIASPIFSPTQLTPSVPTYDDPDSPGVKQVSPSTISNIAKQSSGTSVFNFTNQNINQSHLPVNKNVSDTKTPPSEPLKIEINGINEAKTYISPPKLLQTQAPKSPPKFSPPPPPKVEEKTPEKTLTVTEIEKNLINTVKTLQQPNKPSVVCVNASVEVVNKNVVPKKSSRPKEAMSNTAVFNFTSRKDVPDYISNDRSRTPGRPELPKVNMHFLLPSSH
ncbi:hypothetical protein NQ314_010934 [Rhamnusium bicolor]|uniref:Uncharacterized protein n=1 Tax=Rhamnusium bicolor TaxID=1586634 RepID=A0AAV8XM61_9CUCU|nr:hypothetical protein NQ314_010934 [Rhamnusium bicolor]